VDLSARMLDEARAKQVYDDLVKAELTAYLGGHEAAFDLVISADTLCYFGVLDDVVRAVARALRPNGQVIFTVEESADAKAPGGYVLETHGRYSHTLSYVTGLLRRAELDPRFVRAELRMESGRPVPGVVVQARKRSGAPHA
jgi:predicted TPR repeat methyltransferase